MPGFDGTGPMGFGPRTGGGFGYCSPGAGIGRRRAPNIRGAGRGGLPWGGGRGRAWGGGRGCYGRRHGAYPGAWSFTPTYDPSLFPPGREAEKNYMENLAADLEAQLREIRDQLDQMRTQSEKSE